MEKSNKDTGNLLVKKTVYAEGHDVDPNVDKALATLESEESKNLDLDFDLALKKYLKLAKLTLNDFHKSVKSTEEIKHNTERSRKVRGANRGNAHNG